MIKQSKDTKVIICKTFFYYTLKQCYKSFVIIFYKSITSYDPTTVNIVTEYPVLLENSCTRYNIWGQVYTI